MEVNFGDEEAMQYLNDPALNELQKVIGEYARDILREAGRIESTDKSTSGDPEITSSDIRDANTVVRKAFRRSRKPWKKRAAEIVSYGGAITLGVLGNMFEERWAPIAFAVVVVVAVLAYTYAVRDD